MSSLQVGLAVMGGLILAALIAHNAWQARKSRPRQAEPVPDTVPDPSWQLDAPPAQSGLVDLRSRPARALALDALIDVVTPIALEGVVSGDAALAALPATRRVGRKPFAVEGWHEQSQQWEPPQAGERYTAFQAGVQLANRSGPLNDIEFSEYVQKTQDFADALNGSPEFPEMRHEVARARELDQFASGHDAQLGVSLHARSTAWSPGYVLQQASRHGFVAGGLPGRLVLPAGVEGMPPLLVLSIDPQAALAEDPTQSPVRELTLSLDVPQVPREDKPFHQLCEIAQALAAEMDGVVTDSEGQLLQTEAMAVIANDLEQLYDTLDGHDLSAGSVQARRLFS